jgi:hypothetical protein
MMPKTMAKTGAPNPAPEQVVELKSRKDGVCHGYTCTNSVLKWSHIQHLKPRQKGGDDKPSNLIALCKSCAGITSRTIALPIHLLNSSKRWLANNPDSDGKVGSLTQLIRDAVTIHITEPEERVDIHTFRKLEATLEEKIIKIKKLEQTVKNNAALEEEKTEYINYFVEGIIRANKVKDEEGFDIFDGNPPFNHPKSKLGKNPEERG